jgi:hypothetical protein
MDRHRSIDPYEVSDDDVESTMLLTGEDLLIILKALDLYAYSLIMSFSDRELEHVKHVAKEIIKSLPKQELDS